jgi:hypothetical protein
MGRSTWISSSLAKIRIATRPENWSANSRVNETRDLSLSHW